MNTTNTVTQKTIRSEEKREYNIRPTIKHKKAVEIISENNGRVKTWGQVMKEAGYSEEMMSNPQRMTQSKGFQVACEEAGLTVDLLNNALVRDIKAKIGNRKPEMELGYKVLGKLRENPEITINHLEITQTEQESIKRITDILSNSVENKGD